MFFKKNLTDLKNQGLTDKELVTLKKEFAKDPSLKRISNGISFLLFSLLFPVSAASVFLLTYQNFTLSLKVRVIVLLLLGIYLWLNGIKKIRLSSVVYPIKHFNGETVITLKKALMKNNSESYQDDIHGYLAFSVLQDAKFENELIKFNSLGMECTVRELKQYMRGKQVTNRQYLEIQDELAQVILEKNQYDSYEFNQNILPIKA